MPPTSPSPDPAPPELLRDWLRAPEFRDWLAQGKPTSRVWQPVPVAAQSFALAALARARPEARLWILCKDIRQQERLHSELESWGIPSLFLPEAEALPTEDSAGDPEIAAERLHVLRALQTARGTGDTPSPPPSESTPLPRPALVMCRNSLDEDVPAPEEVSRRTLTLRRGGRMRMDGLIQAMEDAGFDREPRVFARGQFAVRGGIIDVFPWQAGFPVRIEFFDEEIDSLREFEIHSQTSLRKIDEAPLTLTAFESTPANKFLPLKKWIEPADILVTFDEGAGDEGDPENSICLPALPRAGSTRWLMRDAPDSPAARDQAPATFTPSPLGGFDAGDFVISEARQTQFANQIADWQILGWTVAVVMPSDGEIERFREIFTARPGSGGRLPLLLKGRLSLGFTCPEARLAVLSGEELFGRFTLQRTRRRFNRQAAHHRIRSAFDGADLTPNEHVVHAEYGVAVYRGTMTQPTGRGDREVMILEYADSARLFVPIEQSHLVSRYVGVGGKAPALSTLGGTRWSKLRKRAAGDIEDYAAQLLAMQAERDSIQGFAHTPDTRWQLEFENSFPYRETPDQLRAIRETKLDMEATRPMDRLICGDVGFGKTEVAIRAAFKAVMSGTQACILAPTTVLAQQHFDTFRQRMSGFPVRVEALSRLQSPSEQNQVIAGLRDGSVDIVIGTHRLISKDISFHKLGLVVIDEEQRFGVKHKERFKEMFRLVDVLTLSATPIPRTLYMSLTGLREMSTIETPPPNRLPVQTAIIRYDERVIREAIQREIARGGQVFFLHNRVSTIHRVKERIEQLVPGARALVGHGQMDRHDLEDVMHSFVRRQADILVATTIIESGIDIPNANTIFIDRADMFGLADLYQLRGRVGRSEHKAYAYLLLPRDMARSTGDARRRLGAMREYAALGSGFKVAMRDLEIRGAGSLLGIQQSGHIANIGFDLYCKMLRHTVAKLSGTQAGGLIETVLHADDIAWSQAEHAAKPGSDPAFIPPDYIQDAASRIEAYRRLAECSTLKELRHLAASWRDRFGRSPAAVETLLAGTALRITAAAKRITIVEISERKLMLTRNREFIQIDGRFPRLTAPTPSARLAEALEAITRL